MTRQPRRREGRRISTGRAPEQPHVVGVYAALGIIEYLIASWFFSVSPLGHAEDYLPGGRLEAA